MPENIATGKEAVIPRMPENNYRSSLRHSTPEQREFTYVDKPATYVLLKGSYYEKEGDGKETSAEVVYCVHLGLGAGSGDGLIIQISQPIVIRIIHTISR